MRTSLVQAPWMVEGLAGQTHDGLGIFSLKVFNTTLNCARKSLCSATLLCAFFKSHSALSSVQLAISWLRAFNASSPTIKTYDEKFSYFFVKHFWNFENV